MTAILRTVRRLDERSETKEVCGVTISKDIPAPRLRQGNLRQILAAMEVGDSVLYYRQLRSQDDKSGKMRFVSRQLGPEKFRCWRIS